MPENAGHGRFKLAMFASRLEISYFFGMVNRFTSSHLNQFIQDNEIQAEILHFEVDTPTVPIAAEVASVAPEQIIKSVLFMAEDVPVLVITSGTSRIAWKLLADYLGISRKKLKMANAIQVLGITGYVVGSVSPLGHRQKLRTIVEATIPTLDVVLGGGGELNALLRLSTAELLRVVDPEVVALLIDDV
jgi:prolyl-tRNA editing enzyme YbaK/EbsC (Cys-tRNA(Pro) deacylase)